MTLFALAAVLEAIFLRMALLGDLRTRIVETIGLLLASGLFYLVCTYLVLRGRSPVRPAWVIAAALLFRLTLCPLLPALSINVFLFRSEASLRPPAPTPMNLAPP